eukprot:TRINITY_DN3096_c0_g1_i1.p1 TRINITY_DN3096_c0_g1~~TRINITY_DN3096_c0_g1_i1.p1  ORF type:complete len:514 (-),score=206.54 TRINITY_DN3096_c0_g1_i1:144-1685(-)
MPGYKRERTASKYEEKNVSEFVATCLDFKTSISFHSASEATSLSEHIVLIGTEEQLKAPEVSKLPFHSADVAQVIAAASAGSITGTFSAGRRVNVGVVPTAATRNNCASRPDVIGVLIGQAIADGKVKTLDVFVRCAEELAVATAAAKSMPPVFTAKKGAAEKAYKAEVPSVRIFFPGNLTAPAASLAAVATNIELSRILFDAPTNLLDTTTFTEIAAGYAAKLGCGIDIIMGEELRERGYGGVYGVGKAAEFPPALVTLTYKPQGEMDPKDKIALVGKGIVYDTGGLAIKAPATFMCGMKGDMGGAASVLCGFLACVQLKTKKEMSVTLCLADNAISARAQRNDDIVRMKSGHTVEIINTDAEGRLVLGDGVYHACTELSFTPTLIVDMATLTGAQGIATGHKHAGIYCTDDAAEQRTLVAGRKCGDLCFPLLYAPEYHAPEFTSPVADMRNLMLQTNNAGCSCAGHFVVENTSKDFKGANVHVDLAFPSHNKAGGTGFGVALTVQMFSGAF